MEGGRGRYCAQCAETAEAALQCRSYAAGAETQGAWLCGEWQMAGATERGDGGKQVLATEASSGCEDEARWQRMVMMAAMDARRAASPGLMRDWNRPWQGVGVGCREAGGSPSRCARRGKVGERYCTRTLALNARVCAVGRPPECSSKGSRDERSCRGEGLDSGLAGSRGPRF